MINNKNIINYENNRSISENGLIEITTEKLNLTDITRLNTDNNIKYIYVIPNDKIEVDYK